MQEGEKFMIFAMFNIFRSTIEHAFVLIQDQDVMHYFFCCFKAMCKSVFLDMSGMSALCSVQILNSE